MRRADVVVEKAVDEHQRAAQRGCIAQQRVALVDLGVLVGMAEEAFLPVGVVEPRVGGGGAGDRGVEDVGPAQHGEGRRGSRRRTSLGYLPGTGPGRGGWCAPSGDPGPGYRDRRPPRPRSPGRRTIAGPGTRCARRAPAGHRGRRTGAQHRELPVAGPVAGGQHPPPYAAGARPLTVTRVPGRSKLRRGAHQYPRWRLIDSAATCSGQPVPHQRTCRIDVQSVAEVCVGRCRSGSSKPLGA